jgi:hypothetical protein
MAIFDQPKTSYNNTELNPRVLSEIIQIIDPIDTPLLSRLGLNSAAGKFKFKPGAGKKIEWFEDAYATLVDAVDEAGGWDNSSTTSLTVDDGSKFQPGHVILVESEKLVVSAVSGQELSVYARGFGTTSAATHADDTVVTIVGMSRLEGDDVDYAGIVEVSSPYNFTSIFQKGIGVSGTDMAMYKYAINDEFEYQAMKAAKEALRDIERYLFYGERVEGSASAPRSFGGLPTFVGNNTVAASGTITKADVDGLAESIYLDGGNPDLLVLHPSVANDLRNLLDSSSFIRFGQENKTLGMQPVEHIVTQYGNMELLMDRNMPLATGYMLDTSKIGIYTLRPFEWFDIGRTGDNHKGELIGEFSFVVANNEAHGTITGITS